MRYVFRFIIKFSTVGLFLSQAALAPLREFHRFTDALTKLLDPYLPGFPGGTDSKFDSADLRTLLGSYGTTNLHRYSGAKPCNALYVYSSSLYSILLSTGNQCNSIKAWDIVMISQPLLREDLFHKSTKKINGNIYNKQSKKTSGIKQ